MDPTKSQQQSQRHHDLLVQKLMHGPLHGGPQAPTTTSPSHPRLLSTPVVVRRDTLVVTGAQTSRLVHTPTGPWRLTETRLHATKAVQTRSRCEVRQEAVVTQCSAAPVRRARP